MNKLHDKCSLTYVFQPWSTLHPVAQWWAAASWISFHKYEILLQFAYCSNYIPQIINNLYFIQKIKSHYSKQNRESGTHPQKVASQNISVCTATSTAAAKPIQPQALHSLLYHCLCNSTTSLSRSSTFLKQKKHWKQAEFYYSKSHLPLVPQYTRNNTYLWATFWH